jgi:hypothetical protein
VGFVVSGRSQAGDAAEGVVLKARLADAADGISPRDAPVRNRNKRGPE